ncbi:MAG: hypothetical protein GXO74_04260 [Calditrichaeota bacterium]|nr:hypothetical protein [Calditrichota bacterium]
MWSNKFFGPILPVIFAAVIYFSCASNRPPSEEIKPATTIVQDSSEIRITTPVYFLKINKHNARAEFFNSVQKKYTSFPLAVQLPAPKSDSRAESSFKWQIKNNFLSCQQFSEDSLILKMEFAFFENCFSVKFSVHPPDSGVGVYFFRRENEAMDSRGWSEFFSPEPDDYYTRNPQIDIRTDRDQQWKFAPAPLNLSFHSPAGWFSVGLTELPDATIFAFKNKSLSLDIPWEKISAAKNNFYQLPELLISCNRSEWDGVRDFSRFILQGNKSQQKRSEKMADWWKQPLVSPRGDRLLNQFTADDQRYTLDWVKTFVDSIRSTWIDTNFIFILDGKWNRLYGDPTPGPNFKNLRNFIDWCHVRGIRVILSWKAWQIEPDTKAVRWGLHDGEFCDATHHLFSAYVDSCCKMMLGNRPGQLNADGIQIENLFLTPNPVTADFENPTLGMGIKEAYRYLGEFYRRAKLHKPDALIISSAIDPHFYHIQDMVQLQDGWDNKLRREKRARIIINALPGKLIDAGAVTMYNKIAPYYFATAAIFGMPAIQYSQSFADGKIADENKNFIRQAVQFAANKPDGIVTFSDFGKWKLRSFDGDLLAETAEKGKGIIIYHNNRAEFLSAHNGRLVLLMDNFEIRKVRNEKNTIVPFRKLADGIFELDEVNCGERYFLNLRKIPKFR